jgi:HlyD family secretion protein
LAELSIDKNNLAFKPSRNKKIIGIAIVGLLTTGVGITLYEKIGSQNNVASAMQLITVKRGNVTEVVSASGTVQAPKEISLNFAGGGERLSAINVKVGDHVKTGQVLASLDDSTARVQVSNAEANLTAAKSKLSEAQEGASAEDIAVQQANVNKVKVALESVENTYDNQKEYSQLTKAKAALDEVKSNYDSQKILLDSGAIPKSDFDKVNSTLLQAQADYNSAEIQYKQTQSQTQNNIKQAQAAYDAAVAQLKQTGAPPKKSEIESAKASVEQATVQVQEQGLALSKLTIKAPMDGVIVQVNGNVGEIPKSNESFIVMDDSDSNNLQVMAQVSQSDVGKVKTGMDATCTTGTYEGKEFSGKVMLIYPKATTESGVTTYNVLLSVDNKDGLLKPGMTTNVTIQIGTHKDVLYIPPGALKEINGKDGVYMSPASAANSNQNAIARDGQKSENKKAGNQNLHFQPVTVGFFSTDKVEIASGLKEGDRVIESFASPSSSTRNPARGMSGVPGLGGGGIRRGGQ